MQCWWTGLILALTLGFMAGCCAGAAQPRTGGLATQQPAVNQVLDDWHLAAAQADASRYFGHFAADAVFIGTDATERWDLAAFKSFAMPYFERGKAWTYKATRRHVMLSPSGRTAWFDEQLHNAKYGAVRGSGTLIRTGNRWRIAHYVMSFPIPNGVAGKVIAIVRAPAKTTP